MEVSRKKIRFLDFWGSLAEARRTSEQKEFTRAMIAMSIEILVVVQFESSHLTIAMEAWKPASLKAMPPQSNIM
jgi:hypothetical protein